MTHTKNPSLPSIKFLLNDENNGDNMIKETQTNPSSAPRRHHRQSHSISSLPSELQQLSISGPSSQNSIPNNVPSWMIMPPSTTTTTTTTTSATNTTITAVTSTPPTTTTTSATTAVTANVSLTTLLPPLSTPARRPPGASHTRSISDFTLAHPLHSTTPPLPTTHTMLNQRRERHQTHRRTVSANTTIATDFYQSTLTPNNNNNNSNNLPFINELPHRARTASPPSSNHLLSDALNMNNNKMVKLEEKEEKPIIERDEKTGKYFCPYCKKPFNRPSSLRIHTYSHTGEKPFVCLEEGCGRQFSVQSNMRRHLRVHRLGRSSKNGSK